MNTYAYHVLHRNGWSNAFGPRPTHCHTCGASLPKRKPGDCSTGYGCGTAEPVSEHPDAPVLKQGETLGRSPATCFACCAANDKARMIDTGRAMLYLTTATPAKVSNWPGSLSFPVSRICRGSHNWARVRYDVTFTGPDSRQWRGTQYGDNTQICHCRRLSK